MIFCARATRGLRRPSLDARSGRSISPHPWRDNEGSFERGERVARCPPCSQNAHDERGGMAPVLIPCSRNAHDQNVLVRRPQWDQYGCHSRREKRASSEGSFGWMMIAPCAQLEIHSSSPRGPSRVIVPGRSRTSMQDKVTQRPQCFPRWHSSSLFPPSVPLSLAGASDPQDRHCV
jgi:hypothetical protein